MTDAEAPRAHGSSPIDRVRDAVDAWQQRHRLPGFAYGVAKKYGDDQGARHAALLTYYGFLSLFPLLLLVVGVLNLVLVNDPELRASLIEAVVPEDLQDTVEQSIAALPTSGLPLVVGVVGLVLSGLGVVNSAHDTLNHLAAVPFRDRWGLVPRTSRTLAALLLLAVGAVGVGALSVLVSRLPDLSGLSRAGLFLGTVMVTALVLWGLTALLVRATVRLRVLLPGLAVAAVAVAGLLAFGSAVLPGFVARAGPVYGSFATIAGLFALLALVMQAVVIGAEVAVVRRRRLWPRALDTAAPTPADRRALASLAREQQRIETQTVRTSFEGRSVPDAREPHP